MCECGSLMTVTDYTTGDTIAPIADMFPEKTCYGDFCDPWSVETDLNTGTVIAQYDNMNVYVSVCSA